MIHQAMPRILLVSELPGKLTYLPPLQRPLSLCQLSTSTSMWALLVTGLEVSVS